MRGEQGGIEAMGARLAFVGNGNTAQARDFERKHARGGAIFTDPSAYTYRAIGARSGLVSTLGGTLVHGVRAMRGGHFQTSIEGRPFQQGGVLIAMPGDLAAYAYVSRIAGDHPPSAEILGALQQAVQSAAAAAAAAEAAAAAAAAAVVAPAAPPVQPTPASTRRPLLPPWPGAPQPPERPRTPRWTFEWPSSEPPRSAAG